MNIYEAVLESMRTKSPILRAEDPTILIYPTDTWDCCLIMDMTHPEDVGKRWNPRASDLTAMDWKVQYPFSEADQYYRRIFRSNSDEKGDELQ